MYWSADPVPPPTEEELKKREAEQQQAIAEWHRREQQRFDSGDYLRVPWKGMRWYIFNSGNPNVRYHYPHVSTVDKTKISYTPNDGYGLADRQLSMRPGRYLVRFYESLLSPKEIEQAVSMWKGDHQMKLLIAETPEDIEAVYTHGPRSCMSGADYFSNYPHHPAYAYGAGDLGVAYFKGEEGHAGARTLVHLGKRVYSNSMYGDYETLTYLLHQAGWSRSESNNNFTGARLLKVPIDGERTSRGNDSYLMPYLDIGYDVAVGDEFFYVDHYNMLPTICAQSTAGRTAAGFCDCCDCCTDDNSLTETPHGDMYCGDCMSEHFEYCDWCSSYVSSDTAHYITGHWAHCCDGCYDDYFFVCKECNTEYSLDRMSEDHGVCRDCYIDLEEDTEGEAASL